MTTISRADIDVLIRPGDVIAVEYLKKDAVADLIGFGEEDSATHALCCLGGVDIVEACITGVTESNLRNYLRGNCRLTVRSASPAPNYEQAEKAVKFWLDRVNDPYDLKMIIGCIPILAAKHVLGFFSKRAAGWAIRKMPNLLASSNLSTCAELAAKGLYEFNATVFIGYHLDNITPGILRTDESLTTKTVLDAVTLVD